ncbi:MAG TPA: SGNH/GDSL hydrolase family protein [Chthonomonadaceae bacterium]|nr:SGNH/GDSL hydrolase family protein [Chthonomonadaceae bacterium]
MHKGLFIGTLSAGAALLAAAAALIAAHPAQAAGRAGDKAAPFYLKDGDRVVFYGDSITDQRLYTTYIESYCVTRFPKRHFAFVHSGWGGDRVTGGGGGPIDVRINRDILPYKPTVVTICLGMNDGSYRAFDQGIFDTYVKGYRHILDRLTKEIPHVRITLLTASAYDDVTRAPGFPGGYNATLKRYGEAVGDLAKEYHCTLADTNAPLVDTLVKAKEMDPDTAVKIIPDRVHPRFGGHMIMAEAVLKAWNAPSTVADIEIDLGKDTGKGKVHGKIVKHVDTVIAPHPFKKGSNGLAFKETDGALPWPLDRDPDKAPDTALALKVTDAESALDRYVLKITGLPAGNYSIRVDDAEITQVSDKDLAVGVDLAALPNLPANKQAADVLALVRKHNDLHFRRWRQVQFPVSRANEAVPENVKAQMDDLDKQEAEVEAAIREAVEPKPHEVEVVTVTGSK